METITDSFREAVVNWLEEKKQSTRYLANLSGCSESTIQKFLTKETINITLERAFQIGRVIGYEFEDQEMIMGQENTDVWLYVRCLALAFIIISMLSTRFK